MFSADEIRDPIEEVVTEHEPVEEGRVVDLMEALQASPDQARDHKPGNAKQTEQKRRARTKKDSAPVARGESKGSKSESAGEDLGELSKEELYELAQELDISGRSTMSRKKLAHAVSDARGGKKAS